MKYTFASLAMAATASALALDKRAACSFTLVGSGGVSGTVGQLSDGQVRIGGGYGQTTFTINNGAITDSAGRGCILSSSNQFQCDMGKAPTGGFAVGANNVVTYNGGSTFYACPAANGIYNIYTVPVANQNKCTTVTLTASGCGSGSAPAQSTRTVIAPAQSTRTVIAPAQSTRTVVVPPQSTRTVIMGPQSTRTVIAPAQSTITVIVPPASTRTVVASPTSTRTVVAPAATTAPTTPAAGKTCPANLSGAYQYPHLIVPVDSTKPTTAAGTSYFGTVSSTVSSIFNFDIPASYTGTCSLVFLFPTQAQLTTSSYTFSGNGAVNFSQLNTVATQGTTFANQGTVKTSYGTKTVTPGSSTVVATFPCPAGQAVSYSLSSASGTSLRYFQDYNPSPIGLYITTC